MNIFLVTEFFPDEKHPVISGGVQARTFFVAKRLKEKHNLEVISLSAGGIEATTGSLLARLSFFIKVIFSKPKRKPDLIEASNTAVYLSAFLLAKRLQVPAVAWVPDVLGKAWFNNFSLPVALTGIILERLSLKLNWTSVIAMSQATKAKLVKAGVSEAKISVVYGGVDYDEIKGLTEEKYERPTISTIARLLPYKRLGDLVKAVGLVKNKYPEIRCLIIGEGPEKNNLKLQIKKYKLQKNVRLLGNVPYQDAMKTLKRSHLFCLPSVVEGFGIVTVEAMAAGVPFVNARIPPTIEITQGGKGGLLYQPKSSVALAEKIVKLLSDNNLYEKKRIEGLKLAKQFDWDIIARQTEAVWKKTLKEKI